MKDRDENTAKVDWKRSYYAEADQSDALRKECEALRKNAARYRYLVESSVERDDGWVIGGLVPGAPSLETLDDAIDAAIMRTK